MKVVAVVPTYNEKDNIDPLVKALVKERKLIANMKGLRNKYSLEVLFVDDTSPDKTYEVIRKWQKKYTWVKLLLNKEKQGLGGAYAKGIKYAVDKLKADAFVEMDSDFQHNPSDIKRFIAEMDKGADYVIGSRYVKGGSIPGEWGIDRKFLSVVGNLVARILLIMPRVHDVTTGFKLTRVKPIYKHLSLKVPLKTEGFMEYLKGVFKSKGKVYRKPGLISKSFAYKVQWLFETVKSGAMVKEVPIVFLPRTKGESKIISNELWETLRVIFILQMENPKVREFVRFGMVGGLGYLWQAISLQILTWVQAPEWLIWGGAAEVAIVNNFILHNSWTFKSKKINGNRQRMKKFLHFNVTSAGAIAIQMVAGSLLVYLFGPYRQIYLPLIILFLVVPFNYTIYTRIIWKK